MIRVRESRNSSKLLLQKTFRMSPQNVYDILCKLITFQKLIGREICAGYFEYQIIFKCNGEAMHARRELLRSISRFGRNAKVVWDTSTNSIANESGQNFSQVILPLANSVGGCSDASHTIMNH